jgi:hypothetical protein
MAAKKCKTNENDTNDDYTNKTTNYPWFSTIDTDPVSMLRWLIPQETDGALDFEGLVVLPTVG